MFEHNNCIVINKQLIELKDKELNNMKVKDLKELAYIIFKKYNSKSIFENDENRIIVSKRGITESIEKIFNSREQRYLLKEHLQVFSDLGDIIEHATLVNQTRETKNRENINSWNYYFNSLNIDGELYYLEFDVRSLDSGENQYRVQKLQKNRLLTPGALVILLTTCRLLGNLLFQVITYHNLIIMSNLIYHINSICNVVLFILVMMMM